MLTVVAGAGIGFALSRSSAPTQVVTPSPTPPPAPPTPIPSSPRSSFAYSLADFPPANEVAMFGGVDSYGDTWLWNGSRWALARPRVSPPGRFDAPAAYDPETRTILLYGGRLGPGQLVDDTWAWNGSTWRELDGGTGSPPSGEGGAMVWDSARREMVLALPFHTADGLTGETWVWNSSRWVRQPGGDFPSGTAPVVAAFDPASRQVLAVAATQPRPSAAPEEALAFATMSWNGTMWSRLSTSSTPAVPEGLGLDPRSDRLLLASETPAPSGATATTTWAWNGRDWTELDRTSGPSTPAGLVSDPAHGALYLFGAVTVPRQGLPQPVHVWAWQGSGWQRQDKGG